MQELILDDVYGVDVAFTSFWQTSLGYVTLVGICLAVLGLLYGIIRGYRSYRKGTTKDQAVRKLQSLAQKVKNNSIDSKKVYQELTGTIKSYLQWRYDMPRGATDYELTALLGATESDQAARKEVQRIIADAQVIKFGRMVTLREQVLKDITDSIAFVELTGKK